MKIGIIGAGAMSDALGTKWTASGHSIFIGNRTIEKAKALAEKVGHGAKYGSIAEAANYGDVVLLGVHLHSQAVSFHAEQRSGVISHRRRKTLWNAHSD